jgi:N-acetylglucosaminyldiphosphoundecaprenol N-acetyl-beta-D-mannosaminyltransferase
MNMLGITMHCISYDEMFDLFNRWLKDKKSISRRLAVINVHICVSALFDKSLRDIYNSVDLSGIDSMPFVKWARAFYFKKSDHLNAPDILRQVSSKASEYEYTFFFYGGYPGAAEKIEDFLKSEYPGIKVVGKFSPPFRPLEPEEDEAVCKMINDAQPDFVWVGLGSPKQDIWINEHYEKIMGSIIVPSGATFDFFSGRIKQAPQWIRNMGFEWLYRLTRDFNRLWVRYTIFNVIFLFVFFLQIIGVVKFSSDGSMKILGFSV